MKKLITVLLAAAVIIGVLPAAVSAESGAVRENSDYGGAWEINGTTYQSRERIEWPNFGVYMLGNTDEKIGLYMEMTIADKSTEPDGLGGDAGFMVGISDLNGNGIIEENYDEYYLIDISCSNDGGFIAIEKNKAKWGDWEVIDHSSSFQKGAVVGLCLIYDPAVSYFAVYISEIDSEGKAMTEPDPWIEWTDDSDPFTGKGYGLCSKITDGVFNNVRVLKGDEAVPPQATDFTPAYDPDAQKILIADFTDPETVKKTLGTGNDCNLEFDEENGCLKVTVTGPDPFFKLPMNMRTYFDGEKYTVITLNYKTEEFAQAEIFYTTNSSRDIARNHIFFDLEDTEDFADLDVDMLFDDYGNWQEQIRSIRIDPSHNGVEDTVFYFRYVYAQTENAGEQSDTSAEPSTDDSQTEPDTEPDTEPEQTDTQTEAAADGTTVTSAEEAKDTADDSTKSSGLGTPAIIGIAAGAVALVAAAVSAVLVVKKKKR